MASKMDFSYKKFKLTNEDELLKPIIPIRFWILDYNFDI
jgi:hypothetical protein